MRPRNRLRGLVSGALDIAARKSQDALAILKPIREHIETSERIVVSLVHNNLRMACGDYGSHSPHFHCPLHTASRPKTILFSVRSRIRLLLHFFSAPPAPSGTGVTSRGFFFLGPFSARYSCLPSPAPLAGEHEPTRPAQTNVGRSS